MSPSPARAAAEDVRAVGRIDVVPSILDVVCRVTGLRFAAVARVTEVDWTACAVRDGLGFGLEPGGELRIETTFCQKIRASGDPVIIEHATEDPVFCDHPSPKMYGFESYISVPIRRPDGTFFGTLCALDKSPARLKVPQTEAMFALFAQLIGFHLDAQDRLERSEAALLDERRTAELREQFIAILGHDLRNPLAAVAAGASLLSGRPLDERSSSLVASIQKSCARMAGLVGNLLDFARGRLGGGVPVERVADGRRLAECLGHVVEELRAVWPERAIRTEMTLEHPVFCDCERVGQLLSNLLANALTHGASDGPIGVRARSGEDGAFELSVANPGGPIPTETMERLFQPFSRRVDGRPHSGLGLGLYIASEIARAHGGEISVFSNERETRFTFAMPAPPPS
ncbi:MAG: GAF domain-containing sensor histidine kinase [Acetobacteraceae bacterium]|nr:GAF domain-containing sensor histidine kinase [Acetobacteraceae bacterium]